MLISPRSNRIRGDYCKRMRHIYLSNNVLILNFINRSHVNKVPTNHGDITSTIPKRSLYDLPLKSDPKEIKYFNHEKFIYFQGLRLRPSGTFVW